MLGQLRPRRGGRGKKLSEAARLLARGELDESNPHGNPTHTQAEDADHLAPQLAALGLYVDGAVDLGRDPVFYLWPENVQAWHFFRAVETQWRHGVSGPTGLDYAGVQCVMDRARIRPGRQRKMWRCVWAMERGALTGWAQARAERAHD